MKASLRHLRLFLALCETGSLTRAAGLLHVTQPAASQALAGLEREAGAALTRRTASGRFPTAAGAALAARARRAFAFLDPRLDEIAPRLRLTATAAQLRALIAVAEAENVTLAARRLGLAQPSVHRAVARLEAEAGRPLFDRAAHGLAPTRAARALARAARLAFVELDQAGADIADCLGGGAGGGGGRIAIGAMPLSRACLLPGAIARFRARRPGVPVAVVDGPFDDLLAGLRRGEIDLTIGALRDPAPIGDVRQETLFTDSLVLVVRPGHPLLGGPVPDAACLAAYPWIVPRTGTPARAHVERLLPVPFAPRGLVESGSLILARELLRESDHIACVSRLQAMREIGHGLLAALPCPLPGTDRPIGLTLRADWLPTAAQSLFLSILRDVAAEAAETAAAPRLQTA